MVILEVSSGQYSASDRIIVNAYPAELVISEVNKDFIEIHNKSARELNLSWWQVQSGSERFMIPKNTIILSGKKLIFSSDVTELDTSQKENAVTQSGYFIQCFDDNNPFLPIKNRFSEVVDAPGQYELVVDMLDKNQKNSITTSEKFTVK